ncbi:MAG TPA: TIR domain-containing protein [Sphingomicrobium sp.]
MTDIFFSYSSVDRERVRPIRDALVAQGFEVFWDQEVPTGLDWDSWIRQHLTRSKCAMAFWSAASIASDNVRHEAVVAKQQGKLISVLLEPLTALQFPMGLYAQQAANLADWNGDPNHDEWRKFRREYEAKLTPAWVRRQVDELEAELVGERARREGAERRDRILQAQIAKEAETQQDLKRERDSARDEVAALKATVEKLMQVRSEAQAREAETAQGLKRERDHARDEVTALKATVEEVTRGRSQAQARVAEVEQELERKHHEALEEAAALGATIQQLKQTGSEAEARAAKTRQDLKRERDRAFAEATALRTTIDELKSARSEAEARASELSQRLDEAKAQLSELTRSTTRQIELLRSAARAALFARGSAVQYVAIAAAVATVGFWTYQLVRPASQSHPPPPTEEASVQPPALANTTAQQPASTATKEATSGPPPAATNPSGPASAQQADSSGNIASLMPAPAPASTSDQSAALAQPAPAATKGLFEIRHNTEATKFPSGYLGIVGSVDECEKECTRSASCNVFSFNKAGRSCWSFSRAELEANPNFDSGVRVEQSNLAIQTPAPAVAAEQPSATGLFTLRANTQASSGINSGLERISSVRSVAECEQSCARSPTCKVFSFNKAGGACSLYTRADFVPNAAYDSGERR